MNNPLYGNSPFTSPLFAAGMQILSNSQRGPSFRPTFGGVPQAMATAQQQAYMQQMMQRQEEEYQREKAEREKLQAFSQNLAGLDSYNDQQRQTYMQGDDYANFLMRGGPQALEAGRTGMPDSLPQYKSFQDLVAESGHEGLTQLLTKARLESEFRPESFTTLGPGDIGIGSRGTQIQNAGPNPSLMSPGAKSAYARGYIPGTPEFNAEAAKVDLRPMVAIDQREELDQDNDLRRDYLANVRPLAAQAKSRNYNLKLIRPMISKVPTGAGANVRLWAGQVLRGIGADPELVGLTGNQVADLEKIRGLLDQLVADELNAAKGPQTDSDAARIRQTLASIDKTTEANEFLIDARIAANNRLIKIEQEMNRLGFSGEKGSWVKAYQYSSWEDSSIWDEPVMDKWKNKEGQGGAGFTLSGEKR